MFKKYVNISTYAGWADYFDDNDVRWRRHDSRDWYDFYTIEDDQQKYISSMHKGLRHYGIEELHKQFINMMESLRASGWA